jgi:hypothetical protein
MRGPTRHPNINECDRRVEGEEWKTYHRMTVQEEGHASELLLGVLNGPLNVPKLLLPARLSVRAVFALVLLVQCGPPKAALVVGEDGDPARGPSWKDMFVARDVLCETMDEHDRGFGGGRRTVCPGVELRPLRAAEPGFRERRFSHCSSSGLGERTSLSRRRSASRTYGRMMESLLPRSVGLTQVPQRRSKSASHHCSRSTADRARSSRLLACLISREEEEVWEINAALVVSLELPWNTSK